jgi:hypothetical protein
MRISSFACVLLMACEGSDASIGDPAAPVVSDAATDVAPEADAKPADPLDGMCVSSIRLPTAEAWDISVEYTNGVTALRVPYACPNAAKAAECAFAIKAASRPDESGAYVYPLGDACHVQVPTTCRPCTGDVTVW